MEGFLRIKSANSNKRNSIRFALAIFSMIFTFLFTNLISIDNNIIYSLILLFGGLYINN